MNYKFGLLCTALFLLGTLTMETTLNQSTMALAQSASIWAFPSDRSWQIAAEDNTLPIEVQTAVIEAAAGQTSRTVADLKIVSSQPQNWPDRCLGFAQPGEVCAQALTPGWQVVVTDGLRNWTYRTNDTGDLVRLEESEQ